jgi:hypothetical protein
MAQRPALLPLLLAGLFALPLAGGCAHQVTIDTDPPGATVEVDGEEVGQSPITLDEESGFFDEHKVVIKKEGYAPLEAEVVQSEPIWPLAIGSLCLGPFSFGLSCLGCLWSMRYPDKVEFKLSPELAADGSGATEKAIADEEEDEDPAMVTPY